MSTPARMTWTAVDNISITEHTEFMQLQPLTTLTTVGELSSIEQIEWRHVQPTKYSKQTQNGAGKGK